jgi:hypothetical protein
MHALLAARESESMNLDSLVRRGFQPWKPALGVSELRVWHEYDVPTTGTFTLDNNLVLFTVVGDPDEVMSVWAYVNLTGDDAQSARTIQFDGLASLNDFICRAFADRETVFALARGLEVWRWSRETVRGAAADDLVEAATSVLKRIKESMEQEAQRRVSPSASFRAALADVEAAAEEFIDA